MGNMSYCKFENTYRDLEDCYESMDEDDLSESETKYRRKIIELCNTIATEYGDELDE